MSTDQTKKMPPKKKWKKKKDLKSKPGAKAPIDKKKTTSNEKEIENVAPDSNWMIFLQKQRKQNPDAVSGTDKKTAKSSTDKNAKLSRSKIRNLKRERDATKNSSGSEGGKIWFDDVDEALIEKTCGIKKSTSTDEDFIRGKDTTSPPSSDKQDPAVPASDATENDSTTTDSLSKPAITRHIGLDCEMVGVGFQGKESILARVSLVNAKGDCVYDKFVKNTEKVTDYRTEVSGVRPQDLQGAPSYTQVQKEVSDLLTGKILVGHALTNDLKILRLGHSRRQIRDTQTYKPFKTLMKTKRPALKKLAAEVLKVQIQEGEHSSVVDAATAMKLYQSHKKEWEKSLRVKPDAAIKKHNRGTPGKAADGSGTEPKIHFGKQEVVSASKKKRKNKFEKLKKLKKLREEKREKRNTYEEDSE